MRKPKITLTLFKPKTLKDGSHPVMVRVNFLGERKYFSTGNSAKPEEWDEYAAQFKTEKDGARLNKAMLKNREINAYLARIEAECQAMGANFALDKLGKIAFTTDSLDTYMQRIIEQLIEENRPGNAIVYRTALNALKGFQSNLKFSRIDGRFMQSFANHLSRKGLSQSSQSNYIRTIRAAYNKAIAEGTIPEELYPFSRKAGESSKFKVGDLSTRSNPRGLNREELERVKAFDPGEDHLTDEARRAFLLSYYLRGISITDLARLKWKDIHSGRFQYVRKKVRDRKGGKVLSVKIPEAAEVFLAYYRPFGGVHVLNVLNGSEKNEKSIRQKVQSYLKKVNKGLKIIARECELPEGFSSYWARHTYAKVLDVNGVSIMEIQEALGHSSVSTTQTYLKGLNMERLDALEGIL